MNINIFFDLDGTLIDSMFRLYKLFSDLVSDSKLSYDEYWELKRNKVDHNTILKNFFLFNQQQIDEFQNKWMQNIESKFYLGFDKPFHGTTEFLKNLKNNDKLKLYLVTSRQFNDGVQWQLNNFGWSNIFDGVFVTGQKKEKHELIASQFKVSSFDWIIGDTGKDIETGKILEIRTAAVLSGFRNREVLLNYSPNLIINNVCDLNIKGKLWKIK